MDFNSAPLLVACLVSTAILAGCASQPAVPPEQLCLYGSSSRLLEQPPSNAMLLYGQVANLPGLVDAPANSRDYWFESSDGSLRLCRQRVDAHNVCGSANVRFAQVNGLWQRQSPVEVAVCPAN
ncbi:MAG TPA: hypothetical protein VMH83_01215 [Candidatus Acidoferrum sp.]|nr:hypothetical protein [Candidatus Acidoferrum sp.]